MHTTPDPDLNPSVPDESDPPVPDPERYEPVNDPPPGDTPPPPPQRASAR